MKALARFASSTKTGSRAAPAFRPIRTATWRSSPISWTAPSPTRIPPAAAAPSAPAKSSAWAPAPASSMPNSTPARPRPAICCRYGSCRRSAASRPVMSKRPSMRKACTTASAASPRPIRGQTKCGWCRMRRSGPPGWKPVPRRRIPWPRAARPGCRWPRARWCWTARR